MVVREHVYEAFGDAVPSPSVQSYGGHGASAAAGARAFEVYETERMDEVAERRGADLEARLAHLADHPLVRDIRRIGLWIAIELKDQTTGESLARGLHGRWAVAPLLSRLLLAHGCAAARMSEGLLHVAPPLTSSDTDFDVIADRIPRVLNAAAPLIAAL
jgi:adenosylmethionine-8-amino-7-oxononanoate aminotransferase